MSATNPPTPIRGSCLCGGIRFEIDRSTGPHEVCHCNRCRKTTGAASLAAVGVRAEDYRLNSGRELIASYTAPILNAPPAYTTYFCSRCGSPTPPPEPKGEWLEIPMGLFDDDPLARPERHIYGEFAPDWAPIDDGLPAVSVRDLYAERHGRELPPGHTITSHYGAALRV